MAGAPPGRRILIGSGAAEPMTLVQAMVDKGEHLFRAARSQPDRQYCSQPRK
ncbi:hypothetical protein [Cystobacter ferrugineus]|uniref:hypothetical protein n=1 Tax=Cystobacter ferrugineus TaxID=83449 RepID=UPI000B0C41B5|nr:hypothetical protein [Cystobacter ferrugineus]